MLRWWNTVWYFKHNSLITRSSDSLGVIVFTNGSKVCVILIALDLVLCKLDFLWSLSAATPAYLTVKFRQHILQFTVYSSIFLNQSLNSGFSSQTSWTWDNLFFFLIVSDILISINNKSFNDYWHQINVNYYYLIFVTFHHIISVIMSTKYFSYIQFLYQILIYYCLTKVFFDIWLNIKNLLTISNSQIKEIPVLVLD